MIPAGAQVETTLIQRWFNVKTIYQHWTDVVTTLCARLDNLQAWILQYVLGLDAANTSKDSPQRLMVLQNSFVSCDSDWCKQYSICINSFKKYKTEQSIYGTDTKGIKKKVTVIHCMTCHISKNHNINVTYPASIILEFISDSYRPDRNLIGTITVQYKFK